MEKIREFELSREYLESLKVSIEEENISGIRESLEGTNEADVASLLDELEMEEVLYVLRVLEHEFAADVLIELDEESQFKLVQEMESEELALLLDSMESDDAVDILHQLVVKDREDVISHLQEKEKAGHIMELLRYEEGSAGALMAKEFIKANLNWTVVQTIDEIRRQAENVEKIYSIFNIFYFHRTENPYFGRVHFGIVQYPGIANNAFQLGYLQLKKSLSILGSVILCILTQVSLIPCLSNLLGNILTFFGLQFLKLILQFFQSFFSIILYLSHSL